MTFITQREWGRVLSLQTEESERKQRAAAVIPEMEMSYCPVKFVNLNGRYMIALPSSSLSFDFWKLCKQNSIFFYILHFQRRIGSSKLGASSRVNCSNPEGWASIQIIGFFSVAWGGKFTGDSGMISKSVMLIALRGQVYWWLFRCELAWVLIWRE